MDFYTIRRQQTGRHRLEAQWGSHSYFLDFEYDLRHNPTEEGIRFHPGQNLWPDLWPDVTAAVAQAYWGLHDLCVRLCGLQLSIGFAQTHDVDTDAKALWNNVAWFVMGVVRDHLKPIVPFSDDWFTGTVCALAEGIHAEGAFDRLLILGDALQDAGCDDPFVIDHLQMCPHHGSSCWVVEMIREQLRARSRDGA